MSFKEFMEVGVVKESTENDIQKHLDAYKGKTIADLKKIYDSIVPSSLDPEVYKFTVLLTKGDLKYTLYMDVEIQMKDGRIEKIDLLRYT